MSGKMVDARGVITSIFIMLKEDTYVLIRIEFLVALVTMMFLAMFIVDFHRCRSRSLMATNMLQTIDGLSDHIVNYLLGAMQSASFNNQMFPVWSIVLVSLRASLGYLSGYGITDRERQLTEAANVIKFIVAGVLNGTRGLEFNEPLWLLWAILVLRSMYRFLAHHRAIKSLWHGRSSEFLPEYMHENRTDREKGENSDRPQTYLVYGESSQKVTLKRPEYTLQLDVVNHPSLITLGDISDCSQRLLSSSNSDSDSDSKSNRYKDMSLAFTLSRLLRCRLEDATLHQDTKNEIRGLIISKVTGEEKMEAKRIFRILQWELGFVRDYFYTLYPMVFCRGLSSLCFSVLLSMVTFATAFWLAISIRKAYEPTEETVVLWVGGWNVDVIITWVFLFFMMFKEVWEIITYLLSNWTRLLLVCKYVHSKKSQSGLTGRIMRNALMKSMISLLFISKIADPWDGQIDQYDFLQSCTYNPSFWQKAKSVTLGKTARKLDGRICGEAIKISECVKKAILRALDKIDLSKAQLPREIPSLNTGNHFQMYKWACMDLHTCSQVILVWHIATSFCQIKLVKEGEIDLSKPGFVSSVRSYLKTLCCTVDDKIQKQLDLKTNYDTATSLSRYCAYLQVFRPELLPDSFVVPDLIFLETLQKAQEQAHDCNLKWSWYNKLMVVAQEAAEKNQDAAQNHVDWRLGMNIVQQGATLGKDLISMDKEIRWQILAGVWADLFVHIAPSWNAVDHKNSLESGGEFITLVWALLCHCGIEKSSMWNHGKVCQSNAQVQTSNTESTEEQQESESKTSNTEPVEQQESESNSEVPQENNTEISNTEPVEQKESESNAQVPQENNTEISNTEPVEQQESESNAEVPQENNTEISNTEPVEQQESESNAQVSQENNTEISNTEPVEQQESESNAQVPQENNTETSNTEPVEEQPESESNAQVPQENNTETSNTEPTEEQLESESNAQVPQENNTETSNTEPVEEQPESESNAQVPQEYNTETSNTEPVEEQPESESNAQVPQENNTETSNTGPVEEQPKSESNAQVPQEDNTETSNIQHEEEEDEEEEEEEDDEEEEEEEEQYDEDETE